MSPRRVTILDSSAFRAVKQAQRPSAGRTALHGTPKTLIDDVTGAPVS